MASAVMERPPGTAADWTIPQNWVDYTPQEHAVWDVLYARQTELLQDRACAAFRRGVEHLRLSDKGIPNFEELSERLSRRTGWRVVAVPGLVPDEVFFEHLANRHFVAGRFIRKPEQLDYLQEPDVFHDLFGHVPLLINPVFADYMQAYGRAALAANHAGALSLLARLYWYTVEFGLIRNAASPNGVQIYGAGIVSSKSETLYSLESAAPNRLGFDLARVMQTRYRIDTFQKTYFVLDDFAQLFELARTDLGPLMAKLANAAPFAAGAVLACDQVLNRGTQEGWQADGDV